MVGPDASPVTRRRFLSVSGAALAAAAAVTAVPMSAQSGVGERQTAGGAPQKDKYDRLGDDNQPLAEENPDSEQAPLTDNGSVAPFKYSFDLSHKETDSGGWTRQVTVRELPVAKTMAGVEMRLNSGGIRELHWHVGAEWAFMLYGSARITAVNPDGDKSFVNDVKEGDLWLFPGGVPHSIQGLGPDGCKFLLVFNDGNFNEFDTFLLSDWFEHTPKEVLGKNFGVPESTFDHLPNKKLYIFQSDLPRGLEEEQKQAGAVTGDQDNRFVFRTNAMQPTRTTAGGEVRIVDKSVFPATNIAAAIVRVKPGGIREMHWHPLSDEWQYYVSGKGRMTIFMASSRARTMDFQMGDVGYVEIARPHYVENTGTEDLVFLEVFPIGEYQDISAAVWLAHTPLRLVEEHLHTGEEFLEKIPKTESVVVPV